MCTTPTAFEPFQRTRRPTPSTLIHAAHREWKSENKCVKSEVLQAGSAVREDEKEAVSCSAVPPSAFHTLPSLKRGEDYSQI